MQDNFAVVDIETKNSFFSAGAYDPTKLDISVVGLYTSSDDTFKCYDEHELAALWPKLEEATRVIGFNIIGFDYPVLQKYYHGDINQWPTLDIMYVFKKDHGFRIKLDSLAQENLGVAKSGDGLKAIRLWEQGKIDELKSYCLDDVKITRDLFLLGRDKKLLYFQNNGVRVAWPVDWTIKEVPNAPLTLPF